MERLPTIPEFALYGENAAAIDTEFVHVELIETRSSVYHWEIGAHLHRGLFQVLLLLEGQVEARIDGVLHTRQGPAAICLPPAVIHGFHFSSGSHGFVLTLAERLMFDGHDSGVPGGAGLFNAPCLIDLAPDDPVVARLSALLEQLLCELAWPQPGQARMLEWLVHCVLMLLSRVQAGLHREQLSGRVLLDVFGRFRALVELHFREHWDVPRYAQALHIDEKRLNRLCGKLAQQSAFEIVQSRLMLEARRMLIYVPASIAQIAYELGFNDPAYFCRVFKRYSGVTPRAFRQPK